MKKTMKYLYSLNYPVFEEELCFLEMKSVFEKYPDEKVLFSEKKFNPSNSPFIKYRLDILYEEEMLEELLSKIYSDKLSFEEYKVEYLRLNNLENIIYEERLELVKELGTKIIGKFNLKNPEIILGITQFEGKWIFGISQKNDNKWNLRQNKPCSYSNSMGVKLAKAVVNIAAEGDLQKKIIDPCCGVGTTLVEGLVAGYNISAYEINPQIAIDANTNLIHYNLSPIVINEDMHTIKDCYDASIIDIPYGIFSHTSEKEQQDIIDTARKISKRMVMIAFEDHEVMIKKANFKIIESCTVSKGQFKRYITVCE
ncbi:MAG: TRM11 family SAM-dependent methyltransferase [Fusobacteriaceae bacterium]